MTTFLLLALAQSVLASNESGASPDYQRLDNLLARTASRTSEFLDQFSDVKCTEHVRQEKLNKDEKVEVKEDSPYDYLVILTNAGGELSLDESRLPVQETKAPKKNVSLLVSNGFATLFLVFHPYYSGAFRFTDLGQETIDGHLLQKIQFEHVRGLRTPAALALRGREYPLELTGTAWIDPQTGSLARITAGVEQGLDDIGITMSHEADIAAYEATRPSWKPTTV